MRVVDCGSWGVTISCGKFHVRMGLATGCVVSDLSMIIVAELE